jgi:hypothetical protein
LSLDEQMVEIAPNLLGRELIGRASVVSGEAIDGVNILALSAWRFSVQLHLLDHFGT